MNGSRAASPGPGGRRLSALATAVERSNSPASTVVETLASRQAEWDRREEAQSKLFEYQWKIIEGQVAQTSALAEGLATLQHEVRLLKSENTMIVDEMNGRHSDFDGHRKLTESNHATVQQRLDYVEQFIGDSADKHAKELAAAHARVETVFGHVTEFQGRLADFATLKHHTTMEERLNFLEKQFGDSADRHVQAMQEMHGRLANLGPVEGRISMLEKLGEDHASKHGKHSDTIGNLTTRMQEANQRITDMTHQHQLDKQEHHATVQQRLDYLEGYLGDSADKHAKAVADAQRKVQEAHTKIQDVHGKLSEQLAGFHTKFQDFHGKLLEVNGKFTGMVSKEHHASIEQRMSYLEKIMGDSADRHERHERGLQDTNTQINELHTHAKGESKQRHEAHASMEERLKFLEQFVGDSAEKHAKDLSEARRHIQEVHGKMGEMGTVTHFEERIAYIEKLSGDSAERHDRYVQEITEKLQTTHHASMNQRLDYLEELMGDSVDRHNRHQEEIEKLNQSHRELDGLHRNAKELHDTRHVTIEQRVEFLESKVCDTAGRFSKELDVASLVVQEQQEVANRVSALSKELRSEEASIASIGSTGGPFGGGISSAARPAPATPNRSLGVRASVGGQSGYSRLAGGDSAVSAERRPSFRATTPGRPGAGATFEPSALASGGSLPPSARDFTARQSLFDKIDINGDGVITRTEFAYAQSKDSLGASARLAAAADATSGANASTAPDSSFRDFRERMSALQAARQ